MKQKQSRSKAEAMTCGQKERKNGKEDGGTGGVNLRKNYMNSEVEDMTFSHVFIRLEVNVKKKSKFDVKGHIRHMEGDDNDDEEDDEDDDDATDA